MTQATDSRELRLLIEAILEDRGIVLEGPYASLAFELTTAVTKFRESIKSGLTAVAAKQRIQETIIRGAAKQLPKVAMQERAEKALKPLGYHLMGARDTEIEMFVNFLINQEKEGRTIEKWCTWAINDGFWPGKISNVYSIMQNFLKQGSSPSPEGYNPQGLIPNM